jgi:hypothetical protein
MRGDAFGGTDLREARDTEKDPLPPVPACKAGPPVPVQLRGGLGPWRSGKVAVTQPRGPC